MNLHKISILRHQRVAQSNDSYNEIEYMDEEDYTPPKVTAFIGPSGTGKSHRSAWVAGERGISFILDDGLLINGATIVAGVSAKAEKTKVSSIKRALLTDDLHTNSIKSALRHYKPEEILILGTSLKMINRIAKRLEIDSIYRIIYIQDVADESEMKEALNMRRVEGKHVIPVPTFEIKKHFSGYLLDPLQIFKRREKGTEQFIGEKSVVRPTFSYLGSYTISDYTIFQICEFAVAKIDGVSKIQRFRVENTPDGMYIVMDLVLFYGYNIKSLAHEVQKLVKSEIEWLTSINIVSLNIVIKSLVVTKPENE